MARKIPLLILLFISATALAEYRAYELLLVNEVSGEEKAIFSTLDHLQYAQFYSPGANTKIYYSDSWMCWGNTSYHKPICPRPLREPASATLKTNSEE